MASSVDEAAALKRNVVHQTRLKLALRQLDRDRNVRIREINKDTQVFLHRLGETKKRVGLPDLTGPPTRAASAPVRQKERKRTTLNTKESERRISTPSLQDTNHPFLTKPSSQLRDNSDLRSKSLSGARSLSTSALCPPIQRNETPSRDHETRTPRDTTITPRTNKPRKEVRFSLPLRYTDEEEKLESPRTPSPIVSKGFALMKTKNTSDRPSRRYSASHVRSKYL